MFTLRIVQAKFGDCLIIKYGSQDQPKHLLIDGGPGGVYKNHLRQELEKIHDEGGALELVVLSHIDGDHIVGLNQLTNELKEQQADEVSPVIEIKELWMNTFSTALDSDGELTQAVQSLLSQVNNIQNTMPEADLALQSIPQGNTLRRNALLLGIPINQVVDSNVLSIDTLPEPHQMENISITLIGPNDENLRQLEEDWKTWIRNNETQVLMTDPEVLANSDRSVPNLSSIMFLMEAEGKTILFTGDGRGDFILEGLEQQGLLDDEGTIHVDVFKVPHHGSVRNATAEFFEKVTANIYVISANGHHHNPDFDTLEWIVKSAENREEKVRIICTNETDATTKLIEEFPPEDHNYELQLFEEGINSMDIDLS